MYKKMNLGISLTTLIGITGAFVIFMTPETLMPLLIGVFMDNFDATMQQAGNYVSVEMTGIALTTFFIAPFVGNISRKTIAIMGTLIAVSGYGFNVMSTDYLGFVRFYIGIGEGLVAASVFAAIASCKEPERVFSASVIFVTIFLAATTVIFTQIIATSGHVSFFIAVGVSMIIVAPVLVWLPKAPEPSFEEDDSLPPLDMKAVILLVISSIILEGSQLMLWTFTERIGVSLNMSIDEIGYVLGISSLGGLVGSLLAAWVGKRFGRLIPLLASGFGMAVCYIMIACAWNPTVYMVAQFFQFVFFLFNVAYLVGVSADIDPNGRVSTFTGGITPIMAAITPVAGAALLSATSTIGSSSFAVFGIFCAVSMMVSFLVIMPVVIKQDRQLALLRECM